MDFLVELKKYKKKLIQMSYSVFQNQFQNQLQEMNQIQNLNQNQNNEQNQNQLFQNNSNTINNTNTINENEVTSHEQQEVRVDDSDFDVLELVPKNITPHNSPINNYITELGLKYVTDGKDNSKEKLGVDNRGDPTEKFKEYTALYNYLLINLRNKQNKDLLISTFEHVIRSIYTNNEITNIGLNEALRLGLIPTEPTIEKREDNKSYPEFNYMITASTISEVNGNTIKRIKYGYIYIGVKQPSKNGNGKERSALIIPFNNGTIKTVSKPYNIRHDWWTKMYNAIKCNKNGIELKVSGNMEENLNIFTESPLYKLLSFTNKEFSYRNKNTDIGFKYQYNMNDIKSIKLYSLK